MALFDRRPLRNLLRNKLVNTAVAMGASKEDVEKAIDMLEAESDTPLLDWLMNGGFEALLKFIMELIALFPK